MEFARPFWISPHAKERFRERFGGVGDPAIERILNVQLQAPEIPDAARIDMNPHGPAVLYKILVGDVQATAVVAAPEYVDLDQLPRDPEVWPAVMTVYPGRKHIFKYHRHLRQVRERERKPYEPTWEAWEIETARLMRWIGYTLREVGLVLSRPEKQVERLAWSGRIALVEPRWTEKQLQIACDMRLAGKTYAQIGERLGKSEGAVKSRMLRHRRWVLEDPKRAAFLRVTYLLQNPGRLLRHMRDTDIVGRLSVLWEEDEAS